MVTEEVIVEAKDLEEAKNLIEADSDKVFVLSEIIGGFRIRQGSLYEISKD